MGEERFDKTNRSFHQGVCACVCAQVCGGEEIAPTQNRKQKYRVQGPFKNSVPKLMLQAKGHIYSELKILEDPNNYSPLSKTNRTREVLIITTLSGKSRALLSLYNSSLSPFHSIWSQPSDHICECSSNERHLLLLTQTSLI